MAKTVEEAVKPVTDQLNALRSQITMFSILISFIGILVASGPIIAKLID